MKKEAPISSGILEAYVMGTCTEHEKCLVEEACAVNADVLREVSEIEASLFAYSSQLAPTISDTVKVKIFSEINQKENLNREIRTPNAETKKVKQFSSWTKILLAASVSLVIIVSAINVVYYKKINKINNELSAQDQQRIQLVNELSNKETKMNDLINEMSLLANVETKKIILKSVDPKQENNAVVFWNSTSKATYISTENLSAPPLNMQYQLWAIVGGIPVDMGVLEKAEIVADVQKVKSISNASAFAITIEKKGGSPTPTLNRMIVLGSV